MRYNTLFKMQDFFMNQKLSKVFPQFGREDLNKDTLDDEFIFNKVQTYLAEALGGTVSGDNIIIETGSDTDETRAERRLETLKYLVECMFDNMQGIVNNLKRNTALYTSVSSVSQLAELREDTEKLKYMNEVLDNLNYSPDFGSLGSVKSFSILPYSIRQKAWMKKVGYK